VSGTDVMALVNGARPWQPPAEEAPEVADGAARPPPFVRVDLAAFDMEAEPTPQPWPWDGYMPPDNVTILGGHGGAGKSAIGLMLAACATAGRPCLGQATLQSNVCFFSGEDPADIVRRRLAKIIRKLELPAAQVLQRLHVLDATEGDPALYVESRIRDQMIGGTTRTYDDLRAYVEQNDIRLLIVDNASDCFDGSEIRRASVRAFMRSLAQLVRGRGGAVLLLVHVDKSTARGLSSESYSGSTAWHNSARSRLYLKQDRPGQLELTHEKCNLGPRLPALALEWPTDGLPGVPEQLSPVVQGIQGRNDVKAVLTLIHEFTERGEFVSPEPNSRANAHVLLSSQRGFPASLKRSAETQDLVRDAQRDGLLQRATYKGADRKPRERWDLTDKGRAAIGVAASAASAASSVLAAGETRRNEPAASAASSPLGGVGESPRALTARTTRRNSTQPVRRVNDGGGRGNA
jgi:hypothetical protein